MIKLFDYLKNKKTYIVAEMSANHCGSLKHAIEIVHAAKEVGADCLKLQTYTADTITLNCDNEYFKLTSGLWKGYTRYQLYKEAYTPWEWHKPIFDECTRVGLDFFSSPFDSTAVDFLNNLNVEAFKIASPELVDIPLIKYAASKNKLMIVSCGMGSIAEIQKAIDAIHFENNNKIILLKCTTEYPAKNEDMNIETITDMKNRFNLPVGLSDHTGGYLADVIAVSLGACIIEKHFCISHDEKGPDVSFSLDYNQYKEMVEKVREAETLKGKISYELSDLEKVSVKGRRSLFAIKDIKCGEKFTNVNIKSIRPAAGLPPEYYGMVIGKVAKCNISLGTPLSWELIGD